MNDWFISRENNEWKSWFPNSRRSLAFRFDFDQPSQFSPVLKRLQLSRSRHMWQYTGLGQLKFFLVKEWPWLSTIVCFRFRTDPSVRPEMLKELDFFYSYNTLLTFSQPTMNNVNIFTCSFWMSEMKMNNCMHLQLHMYSKLPLWLHLCIFLPGH